MSGFVDIHTHILPGVDDGAVDVQQALAMIRLAWQDGTTDLCLTPHCRGDHRRYPPQKQQEKFEELCKLVEAELPQMRLYLGNEVRYGSEAADKLLEGAYLQLNGSGYVLLEFSKQALRSQILVGVSDMVNSGFVPIIAHAERCDTFRTFPQLAEEVLRQGAQIQINADSVLGANGFAVKRYAHKLLKNRQVHYIATDAHDCKKRPPLLQKCYLRVCKKYGQAYGAQLFYENACGIIQQESH